MSGCRRTLRAILAETLRIIPVHWFALRAYIVFWMCLVLASRFVLKGEEYG